MVFKFQYDDFEKNGIRIYTRDFAFIYLLPRQGKICTLSHLGRLQSEEKREHPKTEHIRKRRHLAVARIHWETERRFRKSVVLARMYPRSGFRSGGTCDRTLVPVLVPGEHPNVPSFRFSFRGNIRQNHLFWKPPFSCFANPRVNARGCVGPTFRARFCVSWSLPPPFVPGEHPPTPPFWNHLRWEPPKNLRFQGVLHFRVLFVPLYCGVQKLITVGRTRITRNLKIFWN